MRVLMACDQYAPFVGGIERHVQVLARGLVERGHEVAVVTMASPGLPNKAEEHGVRVYRLPATTQRAPGATPSGRPYAPPFPDPELVVSLRRVLDRERPDVVHGHNWFTRSFLPLKALSNAALVETLHDYGLVCAKLSLWYRGGPCSGPEFQKCLRCASRNYGTARGMLVTLGNWVTAPRERAAVDMYVPVSHAVAQGNRLADMGVPYEVVPNFVPDGVTDEADPEHPDLAGLPAGPYWLYVGTMSRHKGVHVLLDAYGRLVEPPPLVLIGSRRPDTPAVFPPGTIHLDEMPHAAVMAAWQRATLAIVPSVFPDPCPTVAIEAMAAGVPVVGSRLGGLTDMVVDGQTGALVDGGDAGALATTLARLQSQPRLLKSMAQIAPDRARLFMASAVLTRLEAIYSRVSA